MLMLDVAEKTPGREEVSDWGATVIGTGTGILGLEGRNFTMVPDGVGILSSS